MQTKPIVRWPGSKTRHLKTILPLIPAHTTYVEPFAGGLAVFLAKAPSKHEVINDLHRELIGLYRNARHHLPALLAELDLALPSRADFADYGEQPGLTELQRAARWFVRNYLSWGGKGETYDAGAHNPDRKIQAIRALHQRLAGVTIECSPYQDVIRRYDSPDTFLFLDPPYLDAPTGNYKGWTEADMDGLAAQLAGVRGRWLLTVDASPANRSIFARWRIREIKKANGFSSWRCPGAPPMKELLISPAERP